MPHVANNHKSSTNSQIIHNSPNSRPTVMIINLMFFLRCLVFPFCLPCNCATQKQWPRWPPHLPRSAEANCSAPPRSGGTRTPATDASPQRHSRKNRSKRNGRSWYKHHIYLYIYIHIIISYIYNIYIYTVNVLYTYTYTVYEYCK